jgi:beta-aspartyl-peptidase (threonine type)
MKQPLLLVGSTNAQIGFAEGMDILRRGGGALDAVEAVIRAVEANPDDHSVGYSGLPNILGEVELDASIMDGKTRAAGAVCAVRDYEHPISIARQVMERLPHVMLAGAGAERFAHELGMKKRDLLTDDARAIYEGRVGKEQYPRYQILRELVTLATNDPEIAASADEYGDTKHRDGRRHRGDEMHFGTTNVIALDANGNFASGVSTSGWAWKYPGRVGDSPIIGAGNYCDNRYGACACTGYGEMAMRANTAHSVVLYMKMGMSLPRAAREAMKDLRVLTVPFPPGMNLIAVDAHGKHCGFTTETERVIEYVFQTDKMDAPKAKARTVVPLKR